jgi:AcrR family transcriptional regulator
MKAAPPVKNLQPAAVRRRGRPRSPEARRAILIATQELITEGGLSAVTIEGIAARAGVGKPTIYRSWPNAQAVTMTALMANEAVLPAPEATSPSALSALRARLHEMVRVFNTPLGRNVAMMIAAAERDTELSKAFRNHFILARRTEGRTLLERAMANDEIRHDIDLEVALDLIYAPFFYRLLMGHAPLNPQFTDNILSLAVEGLGTGRRKV